MNASPVHSNADVNVNSNVDSNEIAKFERLAQHWWDAEGDFKPLHKMNPIRANFIDSKAPVAEQTLLDIGCGGGLLSEAMAQRGAAVTAIDMGAAPLTVARLHAQSQGLHIDYRQLTAEALAQSQPGEFDIVTCMEMLEHVPDPASVISACSALVKPGGDVFFSTINRTVRAYLLTILGAEYVLKLLPKGTHEYSKFIRPSELASWCRASELQLQEVIGVVYHPLSQSFQLNSSDVHCNYIMHLKKPQA